MVDAAASIINSWLMLRDGHLSERKKEMARVYVTETLPKLHSSLDTLRGSAEAPLRARGTILSAPF